MKNIPLFTFILLFSLSESNIAQTGSVTSGIYLSVKDFQNNKIMEEADCLNDKEKFERHDFFSRTSFVVKKNGMKLTFKKNDIYAYRDCKNKVWRFYNDKEYEIKEKRDIYIYALKKVVINGGTIERDAVYYFSKGPIGEIKELNKDNIKVVYPNNQSFHHMLDTAEVNSYKASYSYDFEHKMYKVNYLLLQSLK
jgi:hypothetical protein